MNTEGTNPVTTTTTASGHHDEVVVPELAELGLVDKPDGPGAAMMISAGIGIFVLGFLTVLAEASTSTKTWLQKWEWGQGVGPLAGKTTIAALVYVVSLIVLWMLWRAKNVNLKTAFLRRPRVRHPRCHRYLPNILPVVHPMHSTLADQRADRIAAWATGCGAGLIAFMLAWTMAARITERILGAPNDAYLAMTVALVAGAVAALGVGHRLVSTLNATAAEPAMDRTTPGHQRATA